MKVFHTIDELRNQIKIWRKENFNIALVPTMGFLHAGHESLIKTAAKENDKVVVSIFVNPIQFGPNEDFNTYPRDIEKDINTCRNAGADCIFAPEAGEMYGNGSYTFVNVEKLTEGLCGAKRPGHFRGVCTVVSKLFNIATPDKAYFGQKDAQQLAVIKRMVKDLNFNIEIVGCPIIREADGLAMSSRNTYLSQAERKAALVLNRSLGKAKEALTNGERNAEAVKEIICSEIKKEPLSKIDYIEIADSENLQPADTIKRSVLVAIAVYIGKTRLIDNFTYNL